MPIEASPFSADSAEHSLIHHIGVDIQGKACDANGSDKTLIPELLQGGDSLCDNLQIQQPILVLKL